MSFRIPAFTLGIIRKKAHEQMAGIRKQVREREAGSAAHRHFYGGWCSW